MKALASALHGLWMGWTSHMAKTMEVPPDVLAAWQASWKPYEQLPPHVKAMQDEFSVPNPTANPSTVTSSPAQAAPAGPVAVNPTTGERVQLVNGQWVPVGGGNG